MSDFVFNRNRIMNVLWHLNASSVVGITIRFCINISFAEISILILFGLFKVKKWKAVVNVKRR